MPARPDAMGEWPSMITLAGPWKYHTDPRVGDQAHRPEYDDRDWPTLQVPSNWYLQGLDRSGSVWFRRTFRVPRGQAGRRTRLVFDGIDFAAEVWLNGHPLGTHQGYFERFSFVAGPWLYDDRDDTPRSTDDDRADRPSSPPASPGRSLASRRLARAYQPVLPSIAWTPEKFTAEKPVAATVWIVNDLLTGFDEASLEWTLIATVSDSSGRPLGRNEWTLRVDATAEKPAIERITTEKRAQDGRPQDKRRQR